ncbi:MAG: anti-sigma F factor [Clostridia bacterium]|nr:anti-sigma F factor [Clostridia bacterium]
MKLKNKFNMTLEARSANESFARACVSAFATQLDPTLEEISDIKTAISEAVTNCIVHAYKEKLGKIYITAEIYEENVIKIKIRDKGCGIENIEKAMEPLYTTIGGERAGLGFAVMQSFMDSVKVVSRIGKGTSVTMSKKISRRFNVNG